MATMQTKKVKISRKSPAKKKAKGLHLPSLTIKGFRGFKEMHLPELGRVTLLTGKSGAGKSTVLEAVQIYASAGDFSVITNILDNRGDSFIIADEVGDMVDVPDHGSLFFGYNEPKMGDAIEIGCPKAKNTLKVGISNFESEDLKDVPSSLLSILEEGSLCLIVFSGHNRRIVEKYPFFHLKKINIFQQKDLFSDIPRGYRKRFLGRSLRFRKEWYHKAPRIFYESLGPGLPTEEKIASWYESIQLTPNEDRVLEILRLIKPNIEKLAPQGGSKFNGVRMMAKVENVDSPVPLKGMGEGIMHLLGLVVALVSSKDGIILIDEIENGIHYRLFPQLWEFVMRTAQENNVQVIAATHSWDCFKGFARVAWEMEDIKGQVIRIDRKEGETWAVPYSEEEAFIAAKSDIEVR